MLNLKYGMARIAAETGFKYKSWAGKSATLGIVCGILAALSWLIPFIGSVLSVIFITLKALFLIVALVFFFYGGRHFKFSEEITNNEEI